MLRRSNRRWYSFLSKLTVAYFNSILIKQWIIQSSEFKKTKKSRSSTGSFNKAEIKFMKKARKLFHKGNFVEAARCCTAAIVSANPHSSEEFTWRQSSYLFICFQKRNPNSENYLNRAICYLNSRKWNLAKNDLQTVLSKNPYHVRSNYLLGLVLLESKDFEAAVKHLQKGMKR